MSIDPPSLHHYYWDESLDLQAMKAQAYRNSVDSFSPNPSLIHMHKHGLPCAGREHFQYDLKEDNDGQDQSTSSA